MWHAQLMTLAFGMSTITFLLVMVPGAAVIFFDVVSIVHIPIGAAAMLLSTFLVVRWASPYKTGGAWLPEGMRSFYENQRPCFI